MARYADVVVEHLESPHNRRGLPGADAVGRAGGPSGPRVEIHLKLSQNTVVEASFEAAGCGVTIACCSRLTEWIEGRSLRECLAIDGAALSRELGQLPGDKQHCAELAVAGLRDALGQIERAREMNS